MEEERNQLEETTESPVTEQETPEETAPQEEVSSRPNDINIRQLREAKDQAQKERDELMRRLQEIEQAKQQNVEEEAPLSPDDLVEWRYVQKELKAVREQLNTYQQQSTATATETALRTKYSDFDSIVTKDNIELLRTMEPELADSINANPNLYNKAVAAYKAIKRLNEYRTDQDKERALKNMHKPRASNAASPQSGDTPLSKAHGYGQRMTEERRKEVYEEMQRILRS